MDKGGGGFINEYPVMLAFYFFYFHPTLKHHNATDHYTLISVSKQGAKNPLICGILRHDLLMPGQ